MAESRLRTANILKDDMAGVLADWMAEIRAAAPDARISAGELEAQATEFLRLIAAAAEHSVDVNGPGWRPVREFLEGVSRSRAIQGFTSSETATFVFSLKKPVFTRLRGRSYPFAHGVLIPTLHPAAALRGGAEPLGQMRADFVRAKLALADAGVTL